MFVRYVTHERLIWNLKKGFEEPIKRGQFESKNAMVPRKGLEPSQPYGYWHLKPARLPISPPGQRVIL